MSTNTQFITEYLGALSGKPKPPEVVQNYVSDLALAEHIETVEAAFPEYELTAEDMLADGDKVVVRGTFRGVHRGSFAGIAATGKTVSAGLIIIYQVQNNRIHKHWLQFDLFSLLQQLQGSSSASA
jgi:predicted ester cyclase